MPRSFPKLQWVKGTCIMLALAGADVFADSSRLAEHRVLIPERGEVLGYIVSVETNHYSFLPPPIWRVSCKPGAKAVVMIAPDLAASISIDFLEGDTTKEPAEFARELLSSRFPEGRLRESFDSLTGLGPGTGFEIERQVGEAPKVGSRVIYTVQDSGVIEFTLTAPNARLAELATTFANVVNSFQRPVR